MAAVRYITLAILLLCMFNAAVCMNIPALIVLTCLSALVLACKNPLSSGIWAQIGILLFGITVMLWAGTRTPVLFLFCLTATFLLTSVVLRIPSSGKKDLWITLLLLLGAFGCLTQSTLPPLLFQSLREQKIAYWEKGSWGITQPHDHTLTIQAQYSYDLVKKIIGSTDITDLSPIDEYTELWIVTPTSPWTHEEITRLRRWVARGGRLVVITDHTDLFGHVTAVNPLLAAFSLRAEKNCILDDTGDGGTYCTGLRSLKGLTANSFTGRGETWLLQKGYAERTDYSKNSFFSDNQISDEEIPGLYPVGLTAPFGLGTITLFGDSTLFANFALSRPSAQYLLQKIADAGSPFPCYAVASTFLLLFIALSRRGPLRTACLITSALLLLGILVQPLAVRRTLTYAFSPTMEVRGDWTLAEDNEAKYATLFAASFIHSNQFPFWKGPSTSSNSITCSGQHILPGSPAPAWQPSPILTDRLRQSPSLTIEQFLKALIQDSRYSSFWFDDGIGPLKNRAYRQFWSELTDRKTSAPPIELLPSETITGTIILNQTDRIPVTATLTRLKDNAPWVILGDWIIGKETSPGTILIRSNWQHPAWNNKDLIFQKNQNPLP